MYVRLAALIFQRQVRHELASQQKRQHADGLPQKIAVQQRTNRLVLGQKAGQIKKAKQQKQHRKHASDEDA